PVRPRRQPGLATRRLARLEEFTILDPCGRPPRRIVLARTPFATVASGAAPAAPRRRLPALARPLRYTCADTSSPVPFHRVHPVPRTRQETPGMARTLSISLVLAGALASVGAGPYRVQTTNFVVEAPSPQVAQEVAQYAEVYRKEKAVQWLGREMPTWPTPLP